MSQYAYIGRVIARYAVPGTTAEHFRTVAELGCRDGYDTCKLARMFPAAHIYTFECNPDTLPLCRERVGKLPHATLVEKAVSDTDGELTFLAIDREKSTTSWKDGNPGASSLFPAMNGTGPETYVQKPVTVASTRLETFFAGEHITGLNLLWMDIQGAELMALAGMGDSLLSRTAFVYTEVSFVPVYEGQPLLRDIQKFMNAHGFMAYGIAGASRLGGDAMFVNMAMVKSPLKRLMLRLRNATVRLRTTDDYIGRLLMLKLARYGARPWHAVGQLANRVRRKVLTLPYVARGCLAPRVVPSRVPLTIVMPVGPDDGNVFPHALASLKTHLKHPLADIIVVGHSTPALTRAAKAAGARFIPEDEVFPDDMAADIAAFSYAPQGYNRKGWIVQQLIKLHADALATTDHIYVADADTCLVRPTVVVDRKGRSIFSTADEYHRPYYDAYVRLTGLIRRHRHAFVAHGMVLRKDVLAHLKAHVEDRFGQPWWQCILAALDGNEMSSFSEYETYANFMRAFYPRNMVTRYAFNTAFSRSRMTEILALAAELAGRWRSVSFHGYL